MLKPNVLGHAGKRYSKKSNSLKLKRSPSSLLVGKSAHSSNLYLEGRKTMQKNIEPSEKAKIARKMSLINQFIDEDFLTRKKYKNDELALFDQFLAMSEDERMEQFNEVQVQYSRLNNS